MKKSRYTESQIFQVFKEAEAGVPVPELCRKYGMSNASFYCVQCEAIARGGQRFDGHAITGHCACALQGHGFASSQRAHRNAITHRCRREEHKKH